MSVKLRPVMRSDLRQLMQWRNQPEILERTRGHHEITMEHQAIWFERISTPGTLDHMFVVEVAEEIDVTTFQDFVDASVETSTSINKVIRSWRTVGCVGLCHWHVDDRTAEISFYIGEDWARGRGYCKEALVQLHDWGFDKLGLERTIAEVYSFNTASLCLLNKLGYTVEGRLRSHVERMGRRHDAILLGLLKEEWIQWSMNHRTSSVSEMSSQA